MDGPLNWIGSAIEDIIKNTDLITDEEFLNQSRILISNKIDLPSENIGENYADNHSVNNTDTEIPHEFIPSPMNQTFYYPNQMKHSSLIAEYSILIIILLFLLAQKHKPRSGAYIPCKSVYIILGWAWIYYWLPYYIFDVYKNLMILPYGILIFINIHSILFSKNKENIHNSKTLLLSIFLCWCSFVVFNAIYQFPNLFIYQNILNSIYQIISPEIRDLSISQFLLISLINLIILISFNKRDINQVQYEIPQLNTANAPRSNISGPRDPGDEDIVLVIPPRNSIMASIPNKERSNYPKMNTVRRNLVEDSYIKILTDEALGDCNASVDSIENLLSDELKNLPVLTTNEMFDDTLLFAPNQSKINTTIQGFGKVDISNIENINGTLNHYQKEAKIGKGFLEDIKSEENPAIKIERDLELINMNPEWERDMNGLGGISSSRQQSENSSSVVSRSFQKNSM